MIDESAEPPRRRAKVGDHLAHLGTREPPSTMAAIAEPLLVDLAERVLDLIWDHPHRRVPENHVLRALLVSCGDEIAAALYLARHRYFIQARGHLRTVHEIAEKVELFIQDPKWIKAWASDDYRQRRKVAPAEVRDLLGRGRHDPLYEHLCDGAHYTFRAFQSRVKWKVPVDDPEKKRLVVMTGGTNDPEAEPLFYFHAAPQVIAVLVSSAAGLLEEGPGRDAADDLYIEVAETIIRFGREHYLPWARAAGMENLTEFERIYGMTADELMKDRASRGR